MLIIDKYAYTNKLANVNPMLKLIFVAICLIMATTINNNYLNTMIFIVMFLLTIVVAGIPFINYIKILSIPIGFLLISIMAILLSISNQDIYNYSIRIGSMYIGITNESIFQSVSTIIRVLASISATFFLALTTSINKLITVFNKIRLPNIIIELLVLIYRFIFIFLEEANEMYIAQEMKFGHNGFRNSLKSVSLLIRFLFLRVLLKHKDMINSLDCKLYNGEFKIGD